MKERTGSREGDTRASFFLAPTSSKRLLRRLVRVPREEARGGDSEIFVLSTSFKVHAIKVYDTIFIRPGQKMLSSAFVTSYKNLVVYSAKNILIRENVKIKTGFIQRE